MSKRPKRKLTQYEKQRNRILSYARKLKKKGYEYQNYIPTLSELRKSGVKGQELTKLTRQLKSITPQEIRSHSKQIPNQNYIPYNPEFSGNLYDRIVISNFRALISHFNDYAKQYLNSWLDAIISQMDEHATAVMLDTGAENGLILTYKFVYRKDMLFNYMANMLDYLPEAGDFTKQNIMDAVQLEEDYQEPE